MLPVLWQADKWLLVGLILLTVLRAALPAASLLLTKRLVDLLTEFVRNQNVEWQPAFVIVGLQAGLELLASGTGYLQELITLTQTQKVEYTLQTGLMAKAVRLPLEEYARPGFYDRLQQARNGLSFRGVRWLEQTAVLARNVSALASVLIILGAIHPLLAAGVAVMVVPTVWVQMNFGGLRFMQMRYQTPAVRQMGYVGELMTGQQGSAEVRLFGIAGYLQEKWRQLFWQNAGELLTLRRESIVMSLGADTGAVLVGAAAVLALLRLMGGGGLLLSDYVVVLQALQTVRGLSPGIATALAQIFEDALFVTDLFGFLRQSERVNDRPEGGLPFPASLRRGIEARNLSFQYPESPTCALRNVSFHIHPGERVAIVGENGSGKSTLVKCLLGLYSPEAGALCYDGVPLEQIQTEAVRRNVTAVFQEFLMYQMTVRENVLLGDLDNGADEAGVEEALRLSGADEFVRGLPQGVDTPLGSMFSGINLSRGQWQKLAIARTFFRKSQVIALDEPTASLDPVTEALFFEQFAALAVGKTALLVSHRLGMCHSADRILVMKRGELIEQGTHAELMALDGEYARMYRLQASWYEGSPVSQKGEWSHEQQLA